jgi:RsiW-degrading membrane proteinase PrsW (M82 family)
MSAVGADAGVSAPLDVDARRLTLVWRVAAAVTLLVFLWQWPFFVGTDFGRVGTYLIHHGYVLGWMLLVTSFTRTIPLRTLAAFWFVGVFPVMALTLLLSRPIDGLFGGGELAYAYLGPLFEELIKPLPVLALFAYRAWRGGWQLSATDGLLLGFMVGAGFGFHEDAGYLRTWGSGFGATEWSVLFPTVSYFRGNLAPYHDTLAAAVGLAIGFGFLFRRYRLAWVVPVVVWLVVLAEHITGNLLDISGRAPGPAEAIRGIIQGGQGVLIVLVVGIVAAVVLEALILRSVARRDPLFPPIPVRDFITALQAGTGDGVRKLQTMRGYARLRRSLYYSVFTRSLGLEPLGAAAASVYTAGLAAGLPLEKVLAEVDRPDAGAAPGSPAGPRE